MIDPSPPHAVLREFFDNGSLAWGLIACGTAQLSKLFIELIVHRRWRPAVLVETGGMPSSHSALVTGTAACIGWTQGFDHPYFALATVVAFVVMYDASGIRRAAGYTAERVNALSVDLWAEPYGKPLKESLGHSRLQVLVGSLVGPAVALPGLVLVGSPLHLAAVIKTVIGAGLGSPPLRNSRQINSRRRMLFPPGWRPLPMERPSFSVDSLGVARRFCQCAFCVKLRPPVCVGPSSPPPIKLWVCCVRRWISRGCNPLGIPPPSTAF